MNKAEFEGRKRKRKMTQAQIDAEREKSLSKNRVVAEMTGKESLGPTKNPIPLRDRIADAIERSRIGNFNSGHGGGFHKAKTKNVVYGKVTNPTLVRVNGRNEVVDVLKTHTNKLDMNKQKHKGRAR